MYKKFMSQNQNGMNLNLIHAKTEAKFFSIESGRRAARCLKVESLTGVKKSALCFIPSHLNPCAETKEFNFHTSNGE